MTEIPPLTPEALSRLRRLAEAGTDAIQRAKGIAPPPWTHGIPWPEKCIISANGVHVADVRGWGDLRSGRLSMRDDAAFEVQKAWGDMIAAGVSMLPDVPALLDEVATLRAKADGWREEFETQQRMRLLAERERDEALDHLGKTTNMVAK